MPPRRKKQRSSRPLKAARRGAGRSRPAWGGPSPARGGPGSEADYREMFGAANDALFILDAETYEVIDINRKTTELYGFRRDELDLLNAHFRTYADPPHSFEDRVRHVKRAMEAGPFVVEWQAKHRDDHRFWVEVSLKRASIGGRDRILAAVRDITDRKQAEEALRQSEARYRAVVESQTELIIRLRPDGTVTFVNDAMCRFAGVAREALVGANAMSFLSEADQARVRCLIAATVPGRLPLAGETPIQVAPGRVQWMAWEGRGFFDEAGRLTELQAVCRDVTERKAAEGALSQSEARYRAVVEAQTELVVRFTGAGVLTFVNDAYCRYFGKTRDELIGASFLPWLPPEDREAAARRFDAITVADPVVEHEHRAIMPSGEVRWMHWFNRGIFDSQGRLIEVQATGRDITDRKAAEAALRQSEVNYRLLFENNLNGIAIISEGRVLRANKAFCDVHRIAPEAVVGKAITDLVHPDDHERVLRDLKAMSKGEPVNREGNFFIVRGDGTAGWVELHVGQMMWEGKPAYLTIVQDITDRKRLEEELREAQKMEAVGQLAGGIAHDFNNLMTGVLCHAGLLKAASRPGDEVHETAGIIEAAARRASDLTGQLLGFARRGKHQDVPVDLCETVRAVVRLVGGTMDPGIRVEVDCPEGAVWTHGDPAQMEQVILNLAVNARDAMPAGGRMGFAVRQVALEEKACAGRPGAKPGRYASVAVSDTGHGISEEIRSHLFEPFFTTKPLGKGIGMGLAMVYGIAKNHGGWVEVTSQVGRGSTFTVYLPVSAAPRPRPPKAGPEPSDRGVGCILLVDDNAAIRQGASRMLTAAGYRVASAASTDEALRAYDSLGCKVDLVIIDMVMPGGGGRECFHALRRLDPGVKAILCTAGGADEAAARELLGEGMAGFLPKPFQMDQLAAAVGEALAGG